MKLYNTRTRNLETFTPEENSSVKLYTCGPTVYDYLHIGNWLAYIRWDLLVRVLKAAGYDVNRVMNITDVGHLVSDADEGEDKLQKGAEREGKSAWEIAQKYSDDFIRGMRDLNLMPANQMPRATEHIPEQIGLIRNLETKGYTYITSDGVYFDTAKFPSYADFAGLNLAGQQEGARIGVNQEKKNPSDFALWKFTPEGQKRDMEWDSPWGKGFPGWHIECSAMAIKYLGDTLDIHTGGIDHIPVHHTNEIAQSEAATGKRFSNFWLHNNFLMVDGAKISKSLNNGITLDEIVQKDFSLMDFKLFVYQSHYRSESNFSWENLNAASARLKRFQAFADLRFQSKDIPAESADMFKNKLSEIKAALEDDLNTPIALAILDGFTDSIPYLSSADQQDFNAFLEDIEDLLGLGLTDSHDVSDEQKSLISERENARQEQDWPKADALRAALREQGIDINDTEAGPIWYRV